MKQTIIDDYILPVLEEILLPVACGPSHGNELFGKDGCLDSMGLLSLVVLLEEKIAKETGKIVRLVSSAAMSATHSPFRSVDVLADYVMELLGDIASIFEMPCP